MLGSTAIEDIYRWDPAAHRFVVDNRAQLPMDAPDASPVFYQGDQGSGIIWSMMISEEGRRIARVNTQQAAAAGTSTKIPIAHSNDSRSLPCSLTPMAPYGRRVSNCVRFNPHLVSNASQQYPTLIRQVTAGSHPVFGGNTVPDAAEPKLPARHK